MAIKKKTPTKKSSKKTPRRSSGRKPSTRKAKSIETVSEIIFVVDRSGSMQDIAAKMMTTFNEFIAEQRKIPGACRVTITQFDTVYEILHDRIPLEIVPPFILVPRGGTALYDAIGNTIETVSQRWQAEPEGVRASRVLFVVITDGQENQSRRHSQFSVKQYIENHRNAHKWEFLFIGADPTAARVAVDLGISVSNAVHFEKSDVGTIGLLRGLNLATSDYRTSSVLAANGNLFGQAQYTASVASVQADIAKTGSAGVVSSSGSSHQP